MEDRKKLPPITLSNTSVQYLVNLIPILVSMTTRLPPSFTGKDCRPTWWPNDVPWMNPVNLKHDQADTKNFLESLRKVVLSCYKHHGAEDLLCKLDTLQSDDLNLGIDSLDIISLTDETEDSQESSTDENPVFVCCFCLEQYSSHAEVSKHQAICQKRIQEESSAVDTGQPDNDGDKNTVVKPVILHRNTAINDTARQPTPVTSEVRTRGCDHVAVKDCAPKQQPQPQCKDSVKTSKKAAAPAFVPILKTRSQKKLDRIMEKHTAKKLMLQECNQMKSPERRGAWWVSRRKDSLRRLPKHPSECTSVAAFTSALGLAKTSTLASVTKKDSEVDLDCEIIGVEGPLSIMLPPPSTAATSSSTSPRTSKTLMSQLSKEGDGIGSRRRISFCFVEDEWADREALEEGREPAVKSLLTLDFSSPLGQRVKKYVKGKGPLNIAKDLEASCPTEMDDDGYSKLRFRSQDYRVTFRKKRRASNFVHKYKFNKRQVLEFKKRLRTGLTARARRLFRLMRPCKVVLNRLSDSEIKTWTERKIIISDKIYYDDDLCITQVDIPHSAIEKSSSLALKHPVNNGPNSHQSSSIPPQCQKLHSSHPQHPNHHQPLSAYSPHNRLPHNHLSQHPRHHNQLSVPSRNHNHASTHNSNHQHSSGHRGPHSSLHRHDTSHPYHQLNRLTSEHNQTNHHRATASPPHVPNIFRNRSTMGHAPSPPRVSTLANSTNKSSSRPSSPSVTQLLAGSKKQGGAISEYISRLFTPTGQPSSPVEEQQGASHRRKQPMTNLRQEDFGGDVPRARCNGQSNPPPQKKSASSSLSHEQRKRNETTHSQHQHSGSHSNSTVHSEKRQLASSNHRPHHSSSSACQQPPRHGRPHTTSTPSNHRVHSTHSSHKQAVQPQQWSDSPSSHSLSLPPSIHLKAQVAPNKSHPSPAHAATAPNRSALASDDVVEIICIDDD